MPGRHGVREPFLKAARCAAGLLLGCLSALASLTALAAPGDVLITSEAELSYRDDIYSADRTVRSNVVSAPAALGAPWIKYYTDDTYQTQAVVRPSGTRLHIQAWAAACNRAADKVETVDISLQSTRTGDVHTYTATETTPGSGLFRTGDEVVTRLSTGGVNQRGFRGTSEAVSADDNLIASMNACGTAIQAQVLIDPGGVVFDSLSNAEVAGASVTLIDVTGQGNGGNAGGPARVLDYDGVSPLPSQVVTGPDGRYAFPLVAPSTYRLRIVPPQAYLFPTQRAPADLPNDRQVVQPASYGGLFTINATTGDALIDVPLDPKPRALMVQKTASRSVAEIAETVEYSVTVKNVGEFDVDDVSLQDRLPAGFAYVPGSARLDGAAIADPTGGRGPALGFPAGTLAPAASRVFRYRVLVGPGALQGDGINRAQAQGGLPATVVSNVATAQVKVEAGIFTDRAMVLGTVFADCNANGVKDADEPGVPGVRLYLEDGTFVTTDGAGRYSLYGLRPVTHVLKVDAITLPEGARLAPISQRHAGNGNSRFIDPRNGELHRADFAVAGCSQALKDAVQARQDAQPATGELNLSLKTELKPGNASRSAGDVRALSASGLVGETAAAPAAAAAAPVPAVPAPAAPASLEELLPSLDKTLGFIGLHDGSVMPMSVTTLRTKGRAGSPLVLEVNGKPVPDRQVGKRVRSDETGVELREYVGVALKPGDNLLSLVERDGFGNVRGSRSITVQAAGELARMLFVVPIGPLVSDGSLTSVGVMLQDKRGLPVLDRTAITLDASLGQWDVADLDPNQPGTQTFIEGGQARFGLRVPSAPGDALLRASAGSTSVETTLTFLPNLRPLIAVGMLEGTLNARKLDLRSMVPARASDGFEEELRTLAGGSSNTPIGGRAALFLKGKVRGDYLLTLGYDSDKDTRDRLFRDIQPDEFYPVYGDSSAKGFDAQSTGRLYVRVEHNKSYLLLGDFTTQAVSAARQLGAYQRSLTGIKEHYESGRVAATVFASHDSTRQQVVELRANGTSGPFTLAGGNVIANSERVEVLVRDRNQSALVLRATPQVRFTDYEFEPFTGQLLFRAPIPSLDADLNPVSVRVTYEVEQGGSNFWVAGADGSVQLSDLLAVGGSAVKDWNPLAPLELTSLNTTLTYDKQTQLVIEAARTERELTRGGAHRAELLHNSDKLKLRAHTGQSDAGFDNPAAPLSSGRSESGLKATLAVNERTQLIAEALRSADTTTGAARVGARAGVERSFDGGVKVEAGVRSVRDEPASSTQLATDSTALRAKLSTTVPGLPLASVYGEAEQDTRDSDKRMVALGGEYQLANRGRLYLRHEVISSLTGPYQLDVAQKRNATVLGLDTEYMPEGRLFSEYRGRNAFDGRETEAAIGLRNQWQLADGLRLNTSFERVKALTGSDQNESTAATGAVEYTFNPQLKGTARLELRDGVSSDSLLSTLGLAYKLDANWSFLGKNVFMTTRGHGGEADKLQERFQFGLAFRDTRANLSNALSRYEFKREEAAVTGEGQRSVHSISTHADWHPQRDLVLTLQHAAKQVSEQVDGMSLRHSAQLLAGRLTRDFGKVWDAGIVARVLGDGSLQARQAGVGVELGRVLKQNLWLSVGYNVTGFHDRDLSAENYTNRGGYIRIRFKFDEEWLAKAAD